MAVLSEKTDFLSNRPERLAGCLGALNRHGADLVALGGALLAVALALRGDGLASWLAGPDAAGSMLAIAVVFAASLVSSVAGFAFSALAGSGLAHVVADPAQAVQTMAMCSAAIQLYAVIRLWREIVWRRLLPFLIGGAVGVPLGVHWLAASSHSGFALLLGLFLAGYGSTMLWRRSERVFAGHPGIDAAIGVLGGIIGGLAAFPGAFLTIWCGLRGWDKSAQRAVFQPYILAMQLLTLACMDASHPMAAAAPDALLCVAAALVAARIGLGIFGTLSHRRFGQLVNGLLLASGLLLVARSL